MADATDRNAEQIRRLFANSLLLGDCVAEGSGRELVAKAAIRNYKAGSVFFRKGDAGDVMFAIVSGMVRIFASSDDGKEVVLGILSNGDLFGEISLLDGLQRTADAVALSDCTMLVLKRQDFLDHLTNNADFALGLMRGLARRLRATDSQIEDAAFLSLPARIAKRLLQLARDYGCQKPDGVHIRIKLSQQELANLVGVTRESVNRVLVNWFADGLLVRDGRYLVVPSVAALERLALA